MDKICEWHTCQNPVVGNSRFCNHKCKNKFSVDQRRKDLKHLAVEYKGGKCMVCGYDKHISALDFHHLGHQDKDFGLSSKGLTRSWESVKQEIEKCILLCCRCHREAHDGEHSELLNAYSKELETGIHTAEWGLAKTNRVQSRAMLRQAYRKSNCLICQQAFIPLSPAQRYCASECRSKARFMARKVKDRPSKDEIVEMRKTMSWCAIGRKYDVSDNAVKKWMK